MKAKESKGKVPFDSFDPLESENNDSFQHEFVEEKYQYSPKNKSEGALDSISKDKEEKEEESESVEELKRQLEQERLLNRSLQSEIAGLQQLLKRETRIKLELKEKLKKFLPEEEQQEK